MGETPMIQAFYLVATDPSVGQTAVVGAKWFDRAGAEKQADQLRGKFPDVHVIEKTEPAQMVTTHVVVGHDPKSGQRHELAKFFQRAHAEDHSKRLHGWHNVSIETREERRVDQHHAHGGSAT